MPKKNQKSVTLKKETYEVAKQNAERQGKSVAGFVTDLILEKTEEA